MLIKMLETRNKVKKFIKNNNVDLKYHLFY